MDQEGALPFEISKQMQVTSASIDGEPVELLTNSAPRSSIESPYGNDMFVLVPAKPMTAGKTYEVELRNEGRVITDAGNHVYFVGSRGSWFPGRDLQFSNFDLTFHYPKELDLVASGDPVDERVDGDMKVTHRATRNPIRMAGFNLGVYERVIVKRSGLVIEICANHSAERALQPKPVGDPLWVTSAPGRRPGRDNNTPLPAIPIAPPSPANRLQALAADLGDAMDYYASKFGPSGLRTLEVAPVPGRFGQGFPGLIYLSTLSYLQPAGLDPRQNLFFAELLQGHEAAHQWWGNVVTSAGYHDDWVMESLANYSALLFLEKKKGPKVLETMLQSYRAGPAGQTHGEDGRSRRYRGIFRARGARDARGRELEYGRLRQGFMDHPHAAAQDGRRRVLKDARGVVQAVRRQDDFDRGVSHPLRRLSSAQITGPEIGIVFRSMGLRNRNTGVETRLQGHRPGAALEGDRDRDAERRE